MTLVPMAAPDDVIDPAEEAYLEAEGDRVLAPLTGDVPGDVMGLMRDVFVIVAATHPEAIRRRKRAQAAGPVARSGVATKDADAAAPPAAKGKAG